MEIMISCSVKRRVKEGGWERDSTSDREEGGLSGDFAPEIKYLRRIR